MIKKAIGISFALLFVIAVYAGQSFAEIPTLEREALIALYNATGGNSWTQNAFWLGPGSPCSPAAPWYGVTCDATGSNVIGLNLFQNGLSGTLPDELANLTQLVDLTLSFNDLTGDIPHFLGTFSQLKTLYLSSNNFTGSIPSELGQLLQLTNLELYGNQLTGKIPVQLGRLINLVGLALYGNKLSGRIPENLGYLTNLTYFYLDDNELCGEIPFSFLNLVNLSDINGLSVDTNQLYTHNSELDAFLIQKGGEWKSSQDPRSCSPWPMYLQAIIGNSQN